MSEDLVIARGAVQVGEVKPTIEITLESTMVPNLKVTQSDNDEERASEAVTVDSINEDVKCLSIAVSDSSNESFIDAMEKASEEEIKPTSIELSQLQTVSEKITDTDSVKPKKKHFKKHSYRKKKNKKKLEQGIEDVSPIVAPIEEKENQQSKQSKSKSKSKTTKSLAKPMEQLHQLQPQPLQFRKKGHYKNNNNSYNNGDHDDHEMSNKYIPPNHQTQSHHKSNRQRQFSNNSYPPLQHPQPQRRFSGPPKFPNSRLVNHYDSWGYFTPLEPNKTYYGNNPFQRPKRKLERKDKTPIIKKETIETTPFEDKVERDLNAEIIIENKNSNETVIEI